MESSSHRETTKPSSVRFERYVAIGDSSTEGLDDPDGEGGYRGWANRLADHLAHAQGSVLYANLGIRGRRTRQVLDGQLAAALDLEPNLVTLFVGTNDVVGRRFDLDGFASDLDTLQRSLVASGTTVLGFTLPDLAPVMPLARLIVDRVASLNEAIRAVSCDNGALLVDFARYPTASDPRIWSADRLHANSAGHERVAAALAHALGLRGFDDWDRPLPAVAPATLSQVARAELFWIGRYLLPWIWRHSRGRSSGDRRTAKLPRLTRVTAGTGRSATALATRLTDATD